MEELKPCPFCGGTNLAVSQDGGFDCYGEVSCKCGARMQAGYTADAAIEAWNIRVDYHGYEQSAIEAWESIKAWNTRASESELEAENAKLRERCAIYAELEAENDDLRARLANLGIEVE